jgi:FdhE protein
MTHDAWLDAHAYLRPLARMSAEVDSAAADVEIASAAIPEWDEYAADLHEGVPLLQSTHAGIDLEPGGKMASALVRELASGRATGNLAEDARRLDAELRREADAPRRVVDWLLGDDAYTPSSPGLLRYLGWTAMARYLAPIVGAFGRWRDEDRWQRSHCPTCGSPPAMSQLIGVDPGRIRFLSCGCCGTRWRYSRTACPFCENDSHRLAVIAIEGEAHLRIDSCESCRGYLKTYIGQGDERFFLADWTSLHLDFIAHDRGLKRRAASLFDLEPALHE